MTFWLRFLREGSRFSSVEEGSYGQRDQGGDGVRDGYALISFPNSSPDPNLVCPCWFLSLLQNQLRLQTQNQNQLQIQQVTQPPPAAAAAHRRDLADMSCINIYIYWRMHLQAWRRAEVGGHAHVWADGRYRAVSDVGARLR
jgi:hypothetical protein